MANMNIAIKIAALDNASGPIGAITKSLGGLSSAAGTAAKVAGGALVGGAGLAAGALAGVGVAGVKAFGDFDAGMREVFTLLPGITGDAMDEMNSHVLDFSQKMGVLPEETIPALYQALSAGVPPDNVFAFLETAQQAAVGGITSLETSVDGISSVVNAYGDDVLDAARASDVMFTAVRLGKTDFTQLSNSLFNVIPSAASLGVSFEDVAANLAVLTAQGVPTSVATTQIRAALNEAADSGSKLGTAIGELTGKSFTDLIADGMTSAEIFDQLRQSMPEAEFRELFGSVEAMNAALGLTGPNAETVAGAIAEMNNAAGATEGAFETMDGGINRTMERFNAFKSTALIQVGDAFSPLIDRALDFAEGALPQMQEILETNIIPAFETVAGVIAGFTDNLSNGMGPLDAFISAIDGLAPQWLMDALVVLRDDIMPGVTTAFENFSTWFAETGGPAIEQFATDAGAWISEFIEEAKPILEEFSAKWDETLGVALPIIEQNLQRIGEALGFDTEQMDSMAIAVGALQATLDALVIALEAVAVASEGLAWVAEKTREALEIAAGLYDLLKQIGEFNLSRGGDLGSLNLSGLPGFDTGGIVPGPIGSPQLVLAHGGETILPTHQSSYTGSGNTGTSVTIGSITVQANSYTEGQRAGDGFVQALRAQGILVA